MSDLAELVDANYHVSESLVAEPTCGEDFCDACGDCLSCYAGDPCYSSNIGEHRWIVYADKADEWRTNHPEARQLPD